MAECMTFPDTVEEFMEMYKVIDTEHVYSNGIEFVPIFRMKQWFEHEPERKKGKWIPFEHGDETWHKCTACGVADKYIDLVERPNGTIGRLVSIRNFCPNCGAEMRGEEHETD